MGFILIQTYASISVIGLISCSLKMYVIFLRDWLSEITGKTNICRRKTTYYIKVCCIPSGKKLIKTIRYISSCTREDIRENHYTLARRYKFYVLVARTISHSFAALLFISLEHKIHIFSPPISSIIPFFPNGP